MNKRIVSIMIMLSIFFSTFAISGYALGEEVVLPSGLKFGMSVSQATAVSGYDKYGLDDTFFEAYFKECNYEFSTEARLQGEATVSPHHKTDVFGLSVQLHCTYLRCYLVCQIPLVFLALLCYHCLDD